MTNLEDKGKGHLLQKRKLNQQSLDQEMAHHAHQRSCDHQVPSHLVEGVYCSELFILKYISMYVVR